MKKKGKKKQDLEVRLEPRTIQTSVNQTNHYATRHYRKKSREYCYFRLSAKIFRPMLVRGINSALSIVKTIQNNKYDLQHNESNKKRWNKNCKWDLNPWLYYFQSTVPTTVLLKLRRFGTESITTRGHQLRDMRDYTTTWNSHNILKIV